MGTEQHSRLLACGEKERGNRLPSEKWKGEKEIAMAPASNAERASMPLHIHKDLDLPSIEQVYGREGPETQTRDAMRFAAV